VRYSYRQLQDTFYKYMVENEFNLQRRLPREETENDQNIKFNYNNSNIYQNCHKEIEDELEL